MNHGQQGTPVTDPVCGMQIDPASAAALQEWQGQRIHFCSPTCASQFRKEPDKYILPKEPPNSLRSKGSAFQV